MVDKQLSTYPHFRIVVSRSDGASEWLVVNILGGFFISCEVRIAGPTAELDCSPGTTGASGAAVGARGLARQQHQLGFLGSRKLWGWEAYSENEATEMLEREGPHRTEMTCLLMFSWFKGFKGFKGLVILTSFAKPVSKLRLSSWSSVT
jgi:hypothetical protein